jgi:hypothetical protein
MWRTHAFIASSIASRAKSSSPIDSANARASVGRVAAYHGSNDRLTEATVVSRGVTRWPTGSPGMTACCTADTRRTRRIGSIINQPGSALRLFDFVEVVIAHAVNDQPIEPTEELLGEPNLAFSHACVVWPRQGARWQGLWI